ncbi:MAG: hypothetical protein JEY94_06110 [Melioribacteraceae bacterium]|nr:hypothetical protein [Melioribacteraceae bacterium]
MSNINCSKVEGTAFKIIGVESENIKRVYLKNSNIIKAEIDFEINFTEDIVFDDVIIN